MTAQVARRRSRRDVGSRGLLFAYFLATESRSAWRAETRPLQANQACRSHRAQQSLSPETSNQISPSPITSSTSSYQNNFGFVANDRGRVSPRLASYLSCSHKKRNPKNATRLSASLRYVSLRSGQTCVTPFSLRCRPTHCALTALRSDKRRRVRARSIGTLRCQCPQPESRAPGASTREGAGTDGLRDLR